MPHLDGIVHFPCDAQGSPFFCALAAVLTPALGYTENTPHYCAPKGQMCTGCGECGKQTMLQRHFCNLYHVYQTISGVSFGWAWPEDSTTPYQTVENKGPGWDWPDEFIAFLLGFAGLTWRRFSGRDVIDAKDEVYHAVAQSIDAGVPALLKLGQGPDWHVVTGYENGVLYGLDSHEHFDAAVHPTVAPAYYTEDGRFVLPNWQEQLRHAIVITGKSAPSVTLRQVLERILRVLDHPAHGWVAEEVARRIEGISPQNARHTAQWFNQVVSFPIEARWHAAEAFCPVGSPLYPPGTSEDVKRYLGETLFARYIKNDNNETHGTCWKIWGLLDVSPQTGYRVGPAAEEQLLRPGTQRALKELFALVFENDRAVAGAIRSVLEDRG